ncbi:hypothetical protein BTR14_01615 [Rhizobium rhizosphaerae]|uniref:Uncharacterized protein n=1 Tax=Xaviernesmea rhizosphaerae TaxID=1672749 RepID=A0ABX3PI93_9HYPH|nr:hypothetical protein [Xaviernesmea rhizosphaerae]OQP88181.1 hypothetical protein BTR14_01615 [Xaviernesmea rhizosphaerae]
MLNRYQKISEENYKKLLAYIGHIRSAGLAFPSHNGKVNKTAVAVACGFNRETFDQNERFRDCLAAAVTELGLQIEEQVASDKLNSADKAQIARLEQQVAALRSENLELRRKVKRYEHMVSTGRRVIP